MFRQWLIPATAIGALISVGWVSVDWVTASEPDSEGVPTGPDVIVGELPDVRYWGVQGDMVAYSVATTSCNIGDTPLEWYANDTRHPVIGQNMYRYSQGRFSHIGQSWLKHGFFALAQDACGLGCQNPGTGTLLGVGCSDPYSATLNGIQSGLGPRFEVNASTGAFNYPYEGQGQGGNVLYKRLQVPVDRLTEDSEARFFVEGHYIAPDDSAAENDANNASYREVTVRPDLRVEMTGETQQTDPALRAWETIDSRVRTQEIDIPGDGRFLLAFRVTQEEDLWRYEYAVQNLSSHRSAAGFRVPIGDGAQIIGAGFHRPAYHSGEPYEPGDWQARQFEDSVLWCASAVFADSFESGDLSAWQQDSSSCFGGGSGVETTNALRWGNLYNFWFYSDRAPIRVASTLELLRPGDPATVEVLVQAPR